MWPTILPKRPVQIRCFASTGVNAPETMFRNTESMLCCSVPLHGLWMTSFIWQLGERPLTWARNILLQCTGKVRDRMTALVMLRIVVAITPADRLTRPSKFASCASLFPEGICPRVEYRTYRPTRANSLATPWASTVPT